MFLRSATRVSTAPMFASGGVACRHFLMRQQPIAWMAVRAMSSNVNGKSTHGVAHHLRDKKKASTKTGGSKPKRANRGLFGGRGKQSGNNVSFSVNR